MVRILDTHIPNKILYISSAKAMNLSTNAGYNNYVRYFLNPPLPPTPTNIVPNIVLFNAEIPYSFYSVNFNVNKLHYEVLDKTTEAVLSSNTLIIPTGNYNIYQLDSEIQTVYANDTTHNLGTTITLAYDIIKNKISIRTTNETYKIRIRFDLSTITELLGFTHADIITFDNNTAPIISPYVVKVFDYTNLFVVLDNFSLLNSYNNDGKIGGILASIPVMNAGSLLYYTNNLNGAHTNILNYKDSISYIDIRITDGQGRDINFNGKHWQIGILFSYTYEKDIIPTPPFEIMNTPADVPLSIPEQQDKKADSTTPPATKEAPQPNPEMNIVKQLIDKFNA